MGYEIYEVTACPLSSCAWRNSEGSIIHIEGDTLLMAYDEFYGPPYRWDIDDDFWNSRVLGRYSHDVGRTWGEAFLIQPNDAPMNILSPNLLKLPSGELLLFYRKSLSIDPVQLLGYMRRSPDGGRTWGDEACLPDRMPGRREEYFAGRWFAPDANDASLRLSAGRIIVPAGRTQQGEVDHTGVEWPTQLFSFSFISDDEGDTWRRGLR